MFYNRLCHEGGGLAVFRNFMIQYRDNFPIHELPRWDLQNRLRVSHYFFVTFSLEEIYHTYSSTIYAVHQSCHFHIFSHFLLTIYCTISIYQGCHVRVHFPISRMNRSDEPIYQLVTDMKLCIPPAIDQPYI